MHGFRDDVLALRPALVTLSGPGGHDTVVITSVFLRSPLDPETERVRVLFRKDEVPILGPLLAPLSVPECPVPVHGREELAGRDVVTALAPPVEPGDREPDARLHVLRAHDPALQLREVVGTLGDLGSIQVHLIVWF